MITLHTLFRIVHRVRNIFAAYPLAFLELARGAELYMLLLLLGPLLQTRPRHTHLLRETDFRHEDGPTEFLRAFTG